MRRIGWFAASITLVASGAYVFIYLYRWEWHRALFVAVVFVAAEVVIATGLIMRRLGSGPPPDRTSMGSSVPDPQVLAHLRASPTEPDRFAWLARDLGRTNVFVTVLLGGGVVLSAGAWAIDRLAHGTAGRSLDQSLAIRLTALAFPREGLVADDGELLASEPPYVDDPDLRLLLGPDWRR